MSTVEQVQTRAWIKFLKGPLSGTTFDIVQPITTLGRDRSNDIAVLDQKVSRFHARLLWDDGAWRVEKLSQTSSVTVDQQSIEGTTLSHNAVIELGEYSTFLFLLSLDDMQGEDAAQSQPLLSVSQEQTAKPSGTEVASLTALGIPSVEITDNTGKTHQKYPLAQRVINIGRDTTNDVVISEQCVSSFHMQIVREGERYVLIHPHPEQQATANGLLYQGRQIQGNEVFRKPLARGDVFRIADEYGSLVTLTYNDGSSSRQEVSPRIKPLQLGAAKITLGRVQDNDVVLSHPQVSAYHAQLTREQESYLLTDLNSTNHTYVNGLQVTSQLLQPRDEIRIGPFRFIYTAAELTQYDESESIRIDALDLKKVGNNKVTLLNDITIAIPARKFVAIVGGSGAGKSTLMDALNGLRPAQEGQVLYNGQDYYKHLAAFSTQLGYVPQEDIVHRDLTVDRALYYAAKMRLPEDFTETQIKQRIDEVLEDVEMKHRRHLLVSKLSGGQRKRVSIALELLAKPSVFFLDEPTSGLDPGLDRKMMFLLRKLAAKGQTIVLVTHATNNINSCDYVCFLAQGGRLVYFGPPNDAKKFFNKDDFAEIYTALEPTDANPDIPKDAEERFKASPDYQKYVDDLLRQGPAGGARTPQQTVAIKPPKRGDPWKQFALLSMRYIELLKNDVGNLLILLLQAPIIGLILLLIAKVVYNGETLFPNLTNLSPFDAEHMFGGSSADAERVLFVMAFAAVFFGSINGAREIVKEAAIYRRERTVNLGILPSLLSKIVVLGVLCLLQSAVIVLMINIVQPFDTSIFLPSILEIYITIALTSLAGLMVGLAVSAVAHNNDRAMSLIPIILIPQVIFAGSIFPLTSAPIQLLGFLFAVRWAMAALGSTVGLDKFDFGGDRLIGNVQTYNHNAGYLFLTWFALAAMIVLLGFAIAYFLKRKDVRV